MLAVALAATAVALVVVLRHLTYAWDDFLQFGTALRTGIGRQLLTLNLFEHFGPVNRFIHGALLFGGRLDTRWAVAVAVVVFLAYSAALTDLARTLGASWPRTAVALAVTVLPPSVAFVSVDLDPYVHIMIPLASTAAAAGAYARWSRTRRPVHAVVGALAVALACGTQERGIFVVLFLLLARLLVIDGGVPVRRWVRTLLGDWPFLLVPLLVVAVTAAIVSLFYASDAPRGGPVLTGLFIAESWYRHFAPMITGLHFGDGVVPYRLLRAAGNLVLITVALVSLRANRWNVRPWILLVTWYAATMGFVGLGRFGIVPVSAVIDDLQYYAYILPAVVVLVATLRPGRAAVRRPLRSRAALLQLCAAAVLAVLVLLSAAPMTVRAQEFAPGYLATASRDLRAANRPAPATVAPTLVPSGLVPPQYAPYNGGEYFLKEADPRTRVDVDPAHPRFLDATGRLSPAAAVRLAAVGPSAGGAAPAGGTAPGGCLAADEKSAVSVQLPEPAQAPGGAIWVRVRVARGDTDLQVVTSDGTRPSASAPAPIPVGQDSAAFLVATSTVRSVAVLSVGATHRCVQAIELWALRAAGPGGCDWVGPYGQPVPAADARSSTVCSGR